MMEFLTCQSYVSYRVYNNIKPTKDELDYPVAYSIVVHTNFGLVERLIRAIWRPQEWFSKTSIACHQEVIWRSFESISYVYMSTKKPIENFLMHFKKLQTASQIFFLQRNAKMLFMNIFLDYRRISIVLKSSSSGVQNGSIL